MPDRYQVNYNTGRLTLTTEQPLTDMLLSFLHKHIGSLQHKEKVKDVQSQNFAY